MPTVEDVITQSELKALAAVYAANDLLCVSLCRRLEGGATVEPGPITLGTSGESLEEAEHAALVGRVNGFINSGIDLTLPEPEEAAGTEVFHMDNESPTQPAPAVLETATELPDWLTETPLPIEYSLLMLDGCVHEQEVDVTREEFIALKQQLARMRGFKFEESEEAA